MKIAYLSNAAIPSRAANSIQVIKMCHAFARLGHEVTLYGQCDSTVPRWTNAEIFAFYGNKRAFGLELLPQSKLPGRTIKHAVSAVRRINRRPPDIVYSRNLWGAVLSVAAGHETIFEIHEYSDFSRFFHRRAFRYLVHHLKLRRLVAISAALAQDVVTDYPSISPKLMVAHDGADPLDGQPSESSLPRECLKVGYVGHLYPGKGFEMIPPLARRAEYATFHVVGGDPTTVMRLVAAGDLPANVVMHGFMPYTEAQEFRLNCDVLIAPLQNRVSVSDEGDSDIARWTSPLKLFEYMAAGKPILCSDIPVLREILEHERTALMLPPDDVDAWTAALRRVADDPDLGRRLGAAARDEFLNKYTWEKRAEAVLCSSPIRQPA